MSSIPAAKAFFLVIVLTGLAPLAFSAGKLPQEAASSEAPIRGLLPLTKFYETSVPLPPGRPGELIRSQHFDEYYLGEGISAVRILYHSASANSEDVAASGVVLIPDGTPPAGGWPVIAWAHRFIAAARPCAPSLMRGLHSGPLLGMYVNLGYAVVATDYVGLGTNFRNASVDIRSNAIDVINAVPAARAAVPQLGKKWIAVGEAEGGAAVLALAELESPMNDSAYLGSVSISGTLDLGITVEELAQDRWDDSLASLVYGIKTVYPQFQVQDILTEKAMNRYREIDKTCGGHADKHAPAISDMLKAKWRSNPFISIFLERNTLGLMHAPAPLLVINAENPPAMASTAAQVVNRMCRERDRVDFEMYPGLDVAEVIGASVEAQISWIKARFAGRTPRSTCP